jgi:hypothetical protein
MEYPPYIQVIIDIADSLSDLLTIAASALALIIYFTQKEKLGSALNLLLNFSLQLTLTELQNKIDKLNDLNVGIVSEAPQVLNILKEIEGQIKGNKILKVGLGGILADIQNFTEKPLKITEPKKRSLVAELRESLRDIDVSKYHKLNK